MKRLPVIALAIIAVSLSAANGAEASTREDVIPVIEMREVPLPDAVRQVARMARLNVILDPRLSQPPFSEMTVSVHWEKVSARAALIALLDNYELTLIESPRSHLIERR